jgi:hypothetical protein
MAFKFTHDTVIRGKLSKHAKQSNFYWTGYKITQFYQLMHSLTSSKSIAPRQPNFVEQTSEGYAYTVLFDAELFI